jgi:hypothetical protein
MKTLIVATSPVRFYTDPAEPSPHPDATFTSPVRFYTDPAEPSPHPDATFTSPVRFYTDPVEPSPHPDATFTSPVRFYTDPVEPSPHPDAISFFFGRQFHIIVRGIISGFTSKILHALPMFHVGYISLQNLLSFFFCLPVFYVRINPKSIATTVAISGTGTDGTGCQPVPIFIFSDHHQ